MKYRDQDDPLNGAEYQTGKPCVEQGCDHPAGTAWSPFWCFCCNVKRLDRIDQGFQRLADMFEGQVSNA